MASKYYLLTLPAQQYVFAPAFLPDGLIWMRGQLELAREGLLHWQFVICLSDRRRSSFVRDLYKSAHVESTKSAAANDYVWKDDTSVSDSRFEIGAAPAKRNSISDWNTIWVQAQSGKLLEIPADIRIRCYSTLRRIEKDYLCPEGHERLSTVFWGTTGSGKSRRAWEEAGIGAYPKDPNTKFWDGYNGHDNVVIDEFRGKIDISHILRWTDRYPVIIENKGGGTTLSAKRIWFTSNLPPSSWYPDLDSQTTAALLRRLEVIYIGD